MSKYRFKTREEFIRDDLWYEGSNCPYDWAYNGEMNEYLGKDVPDEYTVYCDENENFTYDGWLFRNKDYTLKEQQEYFPDLSQHIGRYIRALVDNPHSGSRVKKGDIGKIFSSNKVAFPNSKNYSCSNALSEGTLGIKYELLPEDYSPKQKKNTITKDGINLEGRYIKVLNDYSIEHYPCIKGDYMLFNRLEGNMQYWGTLKKRSNYFGIDVHLNSYFELMPEGFVPSKQEVKESSVEFISGKWYNFTTNQGKYDIYVKVDFFTDKELYFKDGKYISNKFYDSAGNIDLKFIENPRLVEDLSEIQEYLPEGHPDKITKQKFEIGKWYKWYQKDHSSYHIGKFHSVNDTFFTVNPWIIRCNGYMLSGTFNLLEAEQIQEISLEEVQEFLPNNHPDKITSDEFKKGEYIVITDKFDAYSKDFISNYIYKQRKDSTYLQPEYDSLLSKTNGWIKYKPNYPNWNLFYKRRIK